MPISLVLALNNETKTENVIAKMKETIENSSNCCKEMLLRGIAFDDDVTACFKRLVDDRVWDAIELSDCNGDVDVATVYALQYNKIRCLKLRGEEETIHNCFSTLASNTSLKSLRVTTSWTQDRIRPLSKALATNTHLETMDFRWSTFQGNDTVQTLANGLRKNKILRNLHFSGCGLDDQHFRVLVDDALQQHPALECLDFNGNKCITLPISPKLSKCLQCLDLGFQKTSNSVGERRLNISALTHALYTNKSLKCIKLAENNLNDEDAEEIASALAHNSTLEELYLARNKLTDKGIIKLASLFPSMSGLKKLSLWGNPFSEVGAKALLEGLERNMELHDLELFQNFSVSSLILHHTWINRGGRRILTQADPNEIPLGLWPIVLERVNNLTFPKRCESTARLDVIFFFLKGPVLCCRGNQI